MDFTQTSTYIWIVLPLMVFFARVMDVTLGTIRIIFISQGKRNLAPILGFFEVFIWITIVSQIVTSAKNNYVAYIAYAAGFATGNYIGMLIENRLAIGTQVILAIVQNHSDHLLAHLRAAGYGVTSVDGIGSNGPVKLIYTIVHRKTMNEVLGIIHETHPHAFLSIQDVRSTHEGVFPLLNSQQFGALVFKKTK